MSEGGRMVLVLVADIVWAVYCGILSHLFRQSSKADALATALGCVVVMLAMQT